MRILTVAVLALATSTALATTPKPTPKPEPTPVPSATSTSGAAAQAGAAAGAAAGAQAAGVGLGGSASAAGGQGGSGGDASIASSIDATSTAAGGHAAAQGGTAKQGQAQGQEAVAGAESSSGGNVIDASSEYGVQYIPPVTVAVPPSVVAGSNVVVQVSACGPRQENVPAPVDGTFHGLFRRSRVDQGTTDSLSPARQQYLQVPLPEGGYRLIGHQVTTYAAVIGVSGARQVALGGGGRDWGQGSLGTSSSNQRMVLRHVLHECDAGTVLPPPVAPIPPPVVAAAPPPKKPARRKAVVPARPSAPICEVKP